MAVEHPLRALRRAIDVVLHETPSFLPANGAALSHAMVRACVAMTLYDMTTPEELVDAMQVSDALRQFVDEVRAPRAREIAKARRALQDHGETERYCAVLRAAMAVGSFPSEHKTAPKRRYRLREMTERLAHAESLWSLTPRQAEVLGRIVRGHDNKRIANDLGCASGTVEVHVTHILRKTRAQDRAGLLARFWIDL